MIKQSGHPSTLIYGKIRERRAVLSVDVYSGSQNLRKSIQFLTKSVSKLAGTTLNPSCGGHNFLNQLLCQIKTKMDRSAYFSRQKPRIILEFGSHKFVVTFALHGAQTMTEHKNIHQSSKRSPLGYVLQ